MDGANRLGGHVFISYVHEDAAYATWLQEYLEYYGIPVWRDTVSLWPGQNWEAIIRNAISNSALVFIACFSTNSANRSKSYQNAELTLAIEQLRMRPPEIPWFIPVRFDDCQIPDRDIGGGRTLASIHRVRSVRRELCQPGRATCRDHPAGSPQCLGADWPAGDRGADRKTVAGAGHPGAGAAVQRAFLRSVQPTREHQRHRAASRGARDDRACRRIAGEPAELR